MIFQKDLTLCCMTPLSMPNMSLVRVQLAPAFDMSLLRLAVTHNGGTFHVGQVFCCLDIGLRHMSSALHRPNNNSVVSHWPSLKVSKAANFLFSTKISFETCFIYQDWLCYTKSCGVRYQQFLIPLRNKNTLSHVFNLNFKLLILCKDIQ